MRTLVYVPVIHTSADLGSLAKQVRTRGVRDLGEDFWREHEKTVQAFWKVIEDYFNSVKVSGRKVYQDGMVADGEVAQQIVEEGVKLGSRNHQIISRLLKREAILVKTEDINLVKEERDRLLKVTQAKTISQKLTSFLSYKLAKNRLLNKRDKFIAQRINETLGPGQTGILFIGAYHNIKNRLPKDIEIKEVKDISKVREYHRLLPFYHKNKKRFEELAKYLISPI